ncbi:MAG: CinA family nicotinamide mononucleotide deamidase-related protein [Deltaproteobacteria bacterium]|nr:CinA family nicotinamide mononucleotide deamidase-related protein [Deltaproteobacteria bacterium]
MTVALLSIGTELLRGEVANSNATWLAEELTLLGFTVAVVETVPDEPEALGEALRRLGSRHDWLIATGGLGPTSDDVTAAVAAEVTGRELQCDQDALAAIEHELEHRGQPLRPGHEKQAWVPAGSELLPNARGTAPGFLVRLSRAAAFFLPGVSHEMQQIFREHVCPRIAAAAPRTSFQICLRTYGAAESLVGERLSGLEQEFTGLVLGYCVRGPEVDVKLLVRATSYAQAREQAEAAARSARERLGALVYGEGEDTLPRLARRLLREKGWRLAAAESCTGGLLSELLTSEPASDFFVGSAVTYANSAKTALLGVSEEALRGHGAVSAEVAAEMAEGARRALGCEAALAVTGIAGPSGSSSGKPVGLCFWAVAHPGGTRVEHATFAGSRTEVQRHAALAAFDLLRRTVS